MHRHSTLLQRFSAVTLITTAIIGIWLGYKVTSSIEQAAIEHARTDLAEAMRARRPFWLDSPDPQAEMARLHDGSDYDEWKASMDSMLKGYAIYRVKVWNAERRIVWSDAAWLIGEVHSDNEELNEALEGNVESEISDLSKLENAGDNVDGKVLELYVPILPRGSFEVIGAFEVYQEITDVYDTIEHEQRDAWVLIGSLMLGFYLTMFTMIARASRTLSRLQRISQLERYFSPAVAQAIAAMGSRVVGRERDGPLTGRIEATVMFTDIRGFTRHTERMEPEDVVTMLSDYVDLVTRAVFKHGGSVDKFLGDGVLAVFGAPIPQAGHASKALRAAGQIREELQDLNKQRAARGDPQGHPQIELGTALATGEVVTGTLGRTSQLAYTVVGDTVNLASRMVGMARPGEVLVTARTYEQALEAHNPSQAFVPQDNIAQGQALDVWRFEGPYTLSVRGRSGSVSIYASARPQPADDGPWTMGPEREMDGLTVRRLAPVERVKV